MNVLLSYGLWGSRPLTDWMVELFGNDRAEWPGLLIDSGAVQVRRTGKEVTPEGYAEWLLESRDAWQHAVNLDVIFDPAASKVNHDRLVQLGVDTMPVFHGGEPWGYFEEMVSEHDYVALGGMVTSNAGAGVRPWLGRCFRLADGKAQLHGLGMTRLPLLMAAPWRSVDSSSWGSGHRYGVLTAWNGRTLLRARKDSPGAYAQVLRYVRQAGFNPDRFGSYQEVAVVNAYAWLQMERALQVARPGFTLHLVDGAPFAMKAVAAAWRHLHEGGTYAGRAD